MSTCNLVGRQVNSDDEVFIWMSELVIVIGLKSLSLFIPYCISSDMSLSV